jgi:hypothetical protein
MRAEFALYGHLGVVHGHTTPKWPYEANSARGYRQTLRQQNGEDIDVGQDMILDADKERGEARFVSVVDAADGNVDHVDSSRWHVDTETGLRLTAAAASSPGAAKVPALWVLVTRCWSNDPKKRPSFATIQLELEALDNKPMPVKITRHATSALPSSLSVVRPSEIRECEYFDAKVADGEIDGMQFTQSSIRKSEFFTCE